jgi:hypothetical protein
MMALQRLINFICVTPLRVNLSEKMESFYKNYVIRWRKIYYMILFHLMYNTVAGSIHLLSYILTRNER